MISSTDAEKWLAELQVIGAEIQTMNARLKWLAELQVIGADIQTMNARLKTLLKELERIREKLL